MDSGGQLGRVIEDGEEPLASLRDRIPVLLVPGFQHFLSGFSHRLDQLGQLDQSLQELPRQSSGRFGGKSPARLLIGFKQEGGGGMRELLHLGEGGQQPSAVGDPLLIEACQPGAEAARHRLPTPLGFWRGRGWRTSMRSRSWPRSVTLDAPKALSESHCEIAVPCLLGRIPSQVCRCKCPGTEHPCAWPKVGNEMLRIPSDVTLHSAPGRVTVTVPTCPGSTS